jgi:hypothetical protein
MSMPRRRILRPPQQPPDPRRAERLRRLRERLSNERAALARWMKRLRRAFHAVEKSQLAITRVERLILL